MRRPDPGAAAGGRQTAVEAAFRMLRRIVVVVSPREEDLPGQSSREGEQGRGGASGGLIFGKQPDPRARNPPEASTTPLPQGVPVPPPLAGAPFRDLYTARRARQSGGRRQQGRGGRAGAEIWETTGSPGQEASRGTPHAGRSGPRPLPPVVSGTSTPLRAVPDVKEEGGGAKERWRWRLRTPRPPRPPPPRTRPPPRAGTTPAPSACAASPSRPRRRCARAPAPPARDPARAPPWRPRADTTGVAGAGPPRPGGRGGAGEAPTGDLPSQAVPREAVGVPGPPPQDPHPSSLGAGGGCSPGVPARSPPTGDRPRQAGRAVAWGTRGGEEGQPHRPGQARAVAMSSLWPDCTAPAQLLQPLWSSEL